MALPTSIRTLAKILLVAVLIAINAFPFFISPRTSYEIVFLTLSAIQAELGLFTAWGIFVARYRPYSRIVWCLLGTAIALIAATRILGGQWSSERLMFSLRWGFGATLPAMFPMAAVFLAQRYFAGTEFVPDSTGEKKRASFRLDHLFVLIAAFAFLSLLFRQLIHTSGGWLLESDAVGITVLATSQSFIVGLLAGPAALAILRPSWLCLLWIPYFLVIVAIQPIFDRLLTGIIDPKSKIPWETLTESYLTVVLDNITWYGPQLLPTIVVFVLFRLTGIRVQDSK